MSSKANTVTVVTGGGRGIGRAIVRRLLREKVRIVTCGRGQRPPDLDDAVVWIEADVSRPPDAERLIRAASDHGSLAILVNNAGVQIEKTVTDTTDDEWDSVVGTNCRGVFNMCRQALPEMSKDGGCIINIGSIAGEVSEPSMAIYNASKAFVHALTRSIAVDHGPAVRCNAVCPGWIETELTKSAFAVAKSPDRARGDALARHPAGRLGTPQAVANLVAWLTSEESRFMTGQCLTLDGGLTAASPVRPGLF